MGIFHDRLKELRNISDKTQVQIAEALGIAPQNLSYYFNGREPNFELLLKIAKYFDVSVDYLLGRTNVKKYEVDSHKLEFLLEHEDYSETIQKITECLYEFIKMLDDGFYEAADIENNHSEWNTTKNWSNLKYGEDSPVDSLLKTITFRVGYKATQLRDNIYMCLKEIQQRGIEDIKVAASDIQRKMDDMVMTAGREE